jgi:hypothetical protein
LNRGVPGTSAKDIVEVVLRTVISGAFAGLGGEAGWNEYDMKPVSVPE